MSHGSSPASQVLAFLELAAVLLLVPILGAVAVELTGVEFEDRIRGADLLLVKAIEVPAMLVLLALVLRRSGMSFASIGWRFPAEHLERDLGRGVGMVLPLFFLSLGVSLALSSLGYSTEKPFDVAFDAELLAFLAVGIVAGGISEEILFRGFVFERILSLLPRGRSSSTVQAAVLTSLVFALPHGYQGSAAVGATFAVALALQAMYVMSGRRLLAPMVCHAGFNALQLLLLAGASI